MSLSEYLNLYPHQDLGFRFSFVLVLMGILLGSCPRQNHREKGLAKTNPSTPMACQCFSSEKSAEQRIEKFLSFKNSLTSRSLLSHQK